MPNAPSTSPGQEANEGREWGPDEDTEHQIAWSRVREIMSEVGDKKQRMGRETYQEDPQAVEEDFRREVSKLTIETLQKRQAHYHKKLESVVQETSAKSYDQMMFDEITRELIKRGAYENPPESLPDVSYAAMGHDTWSKAVAVMGENADPAFLKEKELKDSLGEREKIRKKIAALSIPLLEKKVHELLKHEERLKIADFDAELNPIDQFYLEEAQKRLNQSR